METARWQSFADTPALFLKQFGRRLRRTRRNRGLEPEELARRVDTTASQLRKFEDGKEDPGLLRAVLLAAALETSLDELVHGTSEEDGH